MSYDRLYYRPVPATPRAALALFSPPDAMTRLPAHSAKVPTGKALGIVRLVLDDNVTVDAYGSIYSVDHTIHEPDCRFKLTVDHYNRRLKVTEIDGNPNLVCAKLERLAVANAFDKITLKVEREQLGPFLAHGYKLEGLIPQFFLGKDAYLVSRFLSPERFSFQRFTEESELLRQVASRPQRTTANMLPSGYTLSLARESDISELIALYEGTFKTYPTPLSSPDYLLATMKTNVRYVVLRNEKGQVVSAASAEIDFKNKNAEMTDCATLPSERGKGLMVILLSHLESVVQSLEISCAYSMARALEPGMNRVFLNLGYEHHGRLINNCDISGDFEDINLWVKSLS